MILLIGVMLAMMMVGDQVKRILEANLMNPGLLLLLSVLITILVNLISIAISNAVYTRKSC